MLFKPKKLLMFFSLLMLFMIQLSSQVEMMRDMEDVAEECYVIGADDFKLDYDMKNHNGSYEFTGGMDLKFRLDMKEELTVYDTKFNKDIDMCVGKVIDQNTGEKGIAYGTIDRNTMQFRGQFVIGDMTYYVEDANRYMNSSQMSQFNFRPVSILYRQDKAILPDGAFEEGNLKWDSQYSELIAKEEEDNEIAQQTDSRTQLCEMDIRIDQGVYQLFGKDRNKIRNSIFQQVMTLNRIYGETFDNKVKFTIARLAIASDSFCNRNRNNLHCNSAKFKNSGDFLEAFAKQNAKKYCLSYIYTARKNFGGVLGVAYVGGVCRGGSRQSTNTGIVVMRSRSNQAGTDLTFAHEVGHNFGSNHDQTRECTGDRNNLGRFLMYPSSSRVRRPNNDDFSVCSQRDILRTLRLIDNGRKKNCFVGDRAALVEEDDIEDGEEYISGSVVTTSNGGFAILIPILLLSSYSNIIKQ